MAAGWDATTARARASGALWSRLHPRSGRCANSRKREEDEHNGWLSECGLRVRVLTESHASLTGTWLEELGAKDARTLDQLSEPLSRLETLAREGRLERGRGTGQKWINAYEGGGDALR